jgi:hypothetical protein
MSNTTNLKILTILSGVFEHARKLYKLPRKPMADVEKPGQPSTRPSTSSRWRK